VTPKKDVYYVGDVLHCAADANPPAQKVVWSMYRGLADGMVVQTGSWDFTIPSWMAGLATFNLECRVTNFPSAMNPVHRSVLLPASKCPASHFL
jgi:hypothetical protein